MLPIAGRGMTDTIEDMYADMWEMEQQSYRAAVGSVAMRSAELEFALQDAIVNTFQGRLLEAEKWMGRQQARGLVDFFGLLLNEPSMARRIEALFDHRNEVVHGLVEEFWDQGRQQEVLINRKNAKHKPKPSADELEKLADDLRRAALDVDALSKKRLEARSAGTLTMQRRTSRSTAKARLPGTT